VEQAVPVIDAEVIEDDGGSGRTLDIGPMVIRRAGGSRNQI
jgi:hypothetical protein